MTSVDKIKEAIEELQEDDYVLLRHWFLDKDWQRWDQQIDEHSASGKLDFLIKEAIDAKAKDTLREL
ncbi:MAG: hypothetical protein HQL06_14370 [Nitrospirae bacterium]|nr:hypothetical protein [Nitrospirota bacterium]